MEKKTPDLDYIETRPMRPEDILEAAQALLDDDPLTRANRHREQDKNLVRRVLQQAGGCMTTKDLGATPMMTENHMVKTPQGWVKVSELFHSVEEGNTPEIIVVTSEGKEIVGRIVPREKVNG